MEEKKNILENDISDIKHKENDNIVVEEEEEYVEEKLDVYTIEEIDKDVEISNVKGKVLPCSMIFNYKACLDKWVPEPDKEPDDDVYNVLDKVCEKTSFVNGNKYYYYKNKLIDPKIYSRIIQVWHYNAFGHHTDNEGLVLYNRISMLAHSCISTACWHYGENDSFVLRARIKLNPGDEITISYLGDDDLYKSSNSRNLNQEKKKKKKEKINLYLFDISFSFIIIVRREKLTNWLFVCMCSRCTHPVDNCRGFRCSTCGIGTFFIKSEYHDDIPIITKCNVCLCEITESTAYEYIEYENSYIERLQETDKTDLLQRYISMGKSNILSNAKNKICYRCNTKSKLCFSLVYEELGEIHANSINTDILSTENDFTITFEEKKRICSHFLKSIHLLEILCGYSHDYLRDSLNKYYRIDSLTTTDAPQIEE
ncbi:SET domain protein,putative [Plasmodium sp.]|nr:SET domain protein,putative [Plasmodium sp.]